MTGLERRGVELLDQVLDESGLRRADERSSLQKRE
jgi:hypothetical protein